MNMYVKPFNEYISLLEKKSTSENPAQFGTPFARAKKVQQISKELYTYLGTLKSDVTKEFERQKDGQLPYEQMDKGGYIDENWFEGDGYSAKGKDIVNHFSKYVSDMKAAVGNNSKLKGVIEEISSKFNTADIKDGEGVTKMYLDYHFKGFPAIASLTKLTSFQNDVKKALNCLHEQFFEIKTKQLNVFITGVGNVGERLIEQIKQQKKYLKEQLKISLHVAGLSNSRTMIFNDDGIDLNTWKEQLQQGEKASLLLDICKLLGATTYISPVGSRAYLDEFSGFAESGIQVEYQSYQHPVYPQLSVDFISHLSIIDAMCNIGTEATAHLVKSD